MPSVVLPAAACVGGLGLLAVGIFRRRKPERQACGKACCKALVPTAKEKTDTLWKALSKNKDTMVVTRADAMEFFGEKFGKLSVDAMFSQVVSDTADEMTKEGWDTFWEHVKWCGYKDEHIIEEVDNMMGGQAWVDWRDGRKPAQPKRAASRHHSWSAERALLALEAAQQPPG
mmetsp:Transcript_69145/g.223501  ORF Transcript_69145/g.223501 Transcript_69145/m.223501 type:complete len:173 (+) Transcript_69145:3-521(+)